MQFRSSGSLPRRLRVLVRAIALVLALTIVRSAKGQVQFAWPEAPGDVARYTWVEKCLAATTRVRDSVTWWNSSPSDTVSSTLAIDVARRCAARYPAQTASLRDFALVFELYLHAALDADARTLLARRLASLRGIADVRERALVLDSTIIRYVFARTARLAPAESLLIEASRLPDSAFTLEHRVRGYARLMDMGRQLGDTMYARRGAEGLAKIAAGLTPAQQRSQWYSRNGKGRVYDALDYLSASAYLDSLRVSTAAYVALKQANLAKASGERGGMLPFPIGETAPPLEGAVLFGRDSAAGARPGRGKIALVAFLRQGCASELCDAAIYGAFRRVGQRFPTVELTIVAQTFGYFGEEAPLPENEEAQLLRKRVLERRRTPGALTVEATPFTRLPEPDRRRINRQPPNVSNYSFGRAVADRQAVFVVDERGTIIDGFYLNQFFPPRERELVALVEILVKRKPTS